MVIHAYFKKFEKPALSEGFEEVWHLLDLNPCCKLFTAGDFAVADCAGELCP